MEPPKFTFHQQIEEDIVNGFIDSIDTFERCSIEEIFALQDEIKANIRAEKSNKANDELLHPDYAALYASIGKDRTKCYETDVKSGNSVTKNTVKWDTLLK